MKLLPLKLIQIRVWEFWGRKGQFLFTASDMSAHKCRVLGWMDHLSDCGWEKLGYDIRSECCRFYCTNSWPTQQRHWFSGSVETRLKSMLHSRGRADTLCICLEGRLPVCTQRVREFLSTAAGFAAMEQTVQCSLHVLLLPELAGTEVLQGRSGAMKQELREQGKRVEILSPNSQEIHTSSHARCLLCSQWTQGTPVSL